MNRIVAVAVGLGIFAGCAHKIGAPTGLSPRAFWIDQERRQVELVRIIGKLRLSYRGKEQSLSGKGRLLSQLPSQGLLELHDPLGRLVFQAALEKREFVAYYPSQKRAYVGKEGGADYLRRLLGLDAGFAELQRLFLGIVPEGAKHAFGSWDWDSERGEYRGVLVMGNRKYTFFVDGTKAVARGIEVELSGERVHVSYDDFEPCCGEIGRVGQTSNVPLAATVKISLERANTVVEVLWEDVSQLEKARGTEIFRVSLPADTRKIPLGE